MTSGIKPLLSIILLASLTAKISAQSSSNCNCKALINLNFKGKVILYNKPRGEIIKTFQQDLKKEDYLTLTIDKDSSNFFHVSILNALTPKSEKSGWIKKKSGIGTYARNYAENDTLFLYSNPNLKSKIKSIVPSWTNKLYSIFKCFNNWVYVRTEFNHQVKEGWLQPDKQCSNPYTICN